MTNITHGPYDTTDEEYNAIVAAKNRKISRCTHSFKSVYPDFNTPVPVREIEVCTKCGASRSRRWVTREDGITEYTNQTGMGSGSLERWKE